VPLLNTAPPGLWESRTKRVLCEVVLKVWSSNPDYSAGCDYAAGDIAVEFSKLALRRINVLCELKAVDPSVYETYYWDFSAQYFSPWANRAGKPCEVQESGFELVETLENLEVDARGSSNCARRLSGSEQSNCSRRVRPDDRA
jgi:hypothetical protein